MQNATDLTGKAATESDPATAYSARAGFFHPLGVVVADSDADDSQAMPRWRFLFLLAVFATLGIGWAAFTPIHEVASAPGQILTTAPLVNLQHWDGGMVSALLVREGDHVDAGQTILRLDPTASFNNFAALDADLKGKAAEQARWEIVRDALTPATGADAANNDPAQMSAPVVPDARALAGLPDAEQASVHAILSSYEADIALAAQDSAAARAKANALAAQDRALQAAKALTDEKIVMRRTLYAEGAGARLSVLESEREANLIAQQRAEIQGEETVAIMTAQRLAAETRAARDKLLQEADEKIAALKNDIATGDRQLAQLSDKLNRMTVVSPLAGRIQRLGAAGAGSVISPGGLIAEIVPDDNSLVAAIRLQPRDRGFVKIGQDANIKVHSFDFARYGTLAGRVAMISPTTLFDEHQQPYYEVRLKIDPDQARAFADGLPLLPGMTVQADITTGQKTVLQYLLKPLYATLSSALHER